MAVMLPALSSLRRVIGRRNSAVDCRSGRLVAVIHCLLDQNVRDTGAAAFASANWPLLELCRKHRVGLSQLPCPEISCLGMSRTRPASMSLRAALETSSGRECCRQLASAAGDLIAAHVAAGRQVLAVIGGNAQSPGCAVHVEAGVMGANSGIFMQALDVELRGRGLEIPFRGLRDADPGLMADDLRWLEALFSRAR